MHPINWLKRTLFPNYDNHTISRYTTYRSFWQYLHIDMPLFASLLSLACFGLIILYSASSQDLHQVKSQTMHVLAATALMFIAAQIPPHTYKRWSVTLFVIASVLLVAVLIIGHINKGAQRWLGLGFMRFQPSELMKLGIPLMLSHLLAKRPLPPNLSTTLLGFAIIAIPAVLTIVQPDLGTGLLLFGAGISALFLAGLPFRYIAYGFLICIIMAPIFWYLMHDYQHQRVLTFLNPERDPLGAGYHIIQSKIAIGSGGIWGKGWLEGTQSHLHFLPEHATDFIFAVCCEEFGLFGCLLLLTLYALIVIRGFYITINAQDTFSRILAGTLTLTFFLSFFINIGMVTGILPVVGIPLPLVSYGGSSLMTLMIGFGMLMSIHTHNRLLPG